MKPARKPRAAPKVEVEGPAIITPLHVLDRPATDRDMKPITGTQAWRKLTPLQAAFAKGQLKGGCRRYSADERYSAGLAYTKIFDDAEMPGKDSTQALNAIKGNSGGSSNEALAKAHSQLACIHSHLGHNDRQIIMFVLGYGCTPSEAVKKVCADYRDTVSARFREALDGLCAAMIAARERPGEINMRRLP